MEVVLTDTAVVRSAVSGIMQTQAEFLALPLLLSDLG